MVHDVDLSIVEKAVEGIGPGVAKGEDACQLRRIGRGEEIDAVGLEAGEALGDEGRRPAIDRGDADAREVFKRSVDRVEGGVVRHPDGEARGAGEALGPLEAVGPEGVVNVEPATGRYGPRVAALRRHADDPAAMGTQEPLVRARDDEIGAGEGPRIAIEGDPPQPLRDIDGKQRRGMAVDDFGNRRNGGAEAVVEADQRQGDEPRPWREDRDEVFGHEAPVARSPHLYRGGATTLKKRCDARREVEIGNDDLIAVAKDESKARQIERFGGAGADGDVVGFEADHRGGEPAGFRMDRGMPKPAVHPELLVAEVLAEPLTNLRRRDPFGGGVEIDNPGEGRKVAGPRGGIEHGEPVERGSG